MIALIALAGMLAAPAFAGSPVGQDVPQDLTGAMTRYELRKEFHRNADTKMNTPLLVTGGALILGALPVTAIGADQIGNAFLSGRVLESPNQNFGSLQEFRTAQTEHDARINRGYLMTYGGAGAVALGATLCILSTEVEFGRWKKKQGYTVVDEDARKKRWRINPQVSYSPFNTNVAATFGLRADW